MPVRIRRPHHAPAFRAIAPLALLAVAACSDLDGPTAPSLSRTPANSIRHPVLFVHGWNASSSTWNTMVQRFKTDGYSDNELVNWSYDYRVSNATTAGLIKTKVDSMLAATGAAKVDIITHSMGSLSARYYMKNLGGTDRVDALVSLGGANHGTNTAFFCGDTSCFEMRPNSSFLTQLNAKDETPGRTPRYATWWSSCDNVIVPQTSTKLSGASNTETACMDHSSLHEDFTVYTEVRSWVNPNFVPTIASATRGATVGVD